MKHILLPAIKSYLVSFDFTTVHGGKFTGRSGTIGINTENSIEQVNHDVEQIKEVCANYVHSLKPKWNIFILTITSIIEK